MALLLVSFTIYNDCSYAILSVTGQLFYAEVKPGTLEYTLYALAATISGVIAALGFIWVRPHVPIRLETWLLIAYGLLLIQPAWGCIGFADINFGLKVCLLLNAHATRLYHVLTYTTSQARWEFYVQVFLIYLSGTIANNSFRVIFSEMVPPRNEVRWFSLQYILSSSTVSRRSHPILGSLPVCGAPGSF
jgi:MFS-type transporter involved in bile tolerance (Atg22 family)